MEVQVEHSIRQFDRVAAVRKALLIAGRKSAADAIAGAWFEGGLAGVNKLEKLFGVNVIEAKPPKSKFKAGDVVALWGAVFLIDNVAVDDYYYEGTELWPNPGDTDDHKFDEFEKGTRIGTRGDVTKLFAGMVKANKKTK